MQREKAETEEAARGKSDSTGQYTIRANEGAEKPSTPKQTPGVTSSVRKNSTHSSPARSRHQKSRSEAAREATFASLQRALNAAVAARDQYGPGEIDSDTSVSPTTVLPPNNDYASDEANGQVLNQPFSELKGAEDSSVPWLPSQNPEAFGYGGMDAAPYTSAEDWASQVQAPTQSFPGHRAASDAGASYNMHYLQPSEVPLSRRGSSDELANTFEGIGIRSGSSHGPPQHGPQGDQPSAPPKDTGKELDLAARRKRPRPAAIGTSGSGRSHGALNRSPTRLSSINTGQAVRQSKSSQSLGSRYAGVRKASAAQRSPLNFSTFTEAGALNPTKAEMLQPSVTCSMAPPTPITPETLHHLLPTSPTDGYCLSAQPSTQFFPATQPMPIHMASPPATPLPMDVMSQFHYPNVAPPMSAPAQYNSFPEYAPCEAVPLTARSWTDSASIPSPEMAFQNSCQMAQADISPISYDPTVEQPTADSGALHGSPLVYPSKDDMITSTGLAGETKSNDFFIHEFPEQQEVHRYVAQQVPSQKRRNYIFANKTPMAFGNQ